MLSDAPKRRGLAPDSAGNEARNENNHQDQDTTGGEQKQAPPAHLKSKPAPVGGGFWVEFALTIGQGGKITPLDCSWTPHLPSPRDFRRKVKLPKYYQARHEFLLMLSRHLGGPVACCDLPADGEVAHE